MRYSTWEATGTYAVGINIYFEEMGMSMVVHEFFHRN